MTEQQLKMKVTPKKRLRRPKHWSFFFVDDTGKVFYFDKVKGLIIFLLLLMVVCVLMTVISVRAALKMEQNQDLLKNNLEVSQKEIAQLKEENEALLLKLIDKEIHDGKTASLSEADSGMNPEDIPVESDELNVDEPVESPDKIPSGNTAAGTPVDETAPEQPVVLPEKASNLNQFEVNNFFVSHTPETNRLNVQFKLLNISGEKRKTAGQTVVILTGEGENGKNRMILPESAWVNDDLTKGDKGKIFKIANYDYIRMSVDFKMDIKSLSQAVVLVLDRKGDLISAYKFPLIFK